MNLNLSVLVLSAIVVLLAFAASPADGANLVKRPRVDFKTWLKSIYPQMAEIEESEQNGQEKRNRDEDYGHLRFGRAGLGDDYGHMRFGRRK